MVVQVINADIAVFAMLSKLVLFVQLADVAVFARVDVLLFVLLGLPTQGGRVILNVA